MKINLFSFNRFEMFLERFKSFIRYFLQEHMKIPLQKQQKSIYHT